MEDRIGTILAVGLPLLGWGLTMTWNVLRILAIDKELLAMHKDPDSHGFGTKQTNKILMESHREFATCISSNTAVVKELIHYMRWSHRDRTGKDLPPPMAEELE